MEEVESNETENMATASVPISPTLLTTPNNSNNSEAESLELELEGLTEIEEPDFVDAPLNDIVPSFSFSGCGFLGVYHVGVAACLREHTDVVNRREIKFAGASAGALVATTLLCGMNFGEMAEILLDVASTVRERKAVDLRGQLTGLLEKYLPEDAHTKLSNRLYISVTVMDGMECGLVTEFKSKQHLIQCLVATCFVPGFLGWLPPSISADSFVPVGDVFPKLGEKQKKKKKEKNIHDEDNDHRTHEQREEEEELFKERATESILDVIRDVNGASEQLSDNRSYIQMLLDLCLRGITNTSKVVQNFPGMPRSLTSKLENFDDFFIEMLREMLNGENKYMSFDGGFSDNIPSFDSNTITVCPFAGESDICPRDLTCLDISLDLGNTSMQASEDNIYRLSHALNPMAPSQLLKLCEEGYNDCLRYLHDKDLLCCKQHLMTRASLHSSPCNIGHAHCKCDTCQASDSKIRVSLCCVRCQRAKRKALNATLPADVNKEFQKAIKEHENKEATAGDTNLILALIGSGLWTIVKLVYSTTLTFADRVNRYNDLYAHTVDNIMPFIMNRVLAVDQKLKLIHKVLSTLEHCLLESIPIRNLAGVYTAGSL